MPQIPDASIAVASQGTGTVARIRIPQSYMTLINTPDRVFITGIISDGIRVVPAEGDAGIKVNYEASSQYVTLSPGQLRLGLSRVLRKAILISVTAEAGALLLGVPPQDWIDGVGAWVAESKPKNATRTKTQSAKSPPVGLPGGQFLQSHMMATEKTREQLMAEMSKLLLTYTDVRVRIGTVKSALETQMGVKLKISNGQLTVDMG